MGQPFLPQGIPYDQLRTIIVDINNVISHIHHRHCLEMRWTGRDSAEVYISDTHSPHPTVQSGPVSS